MPTFPNTDFITSLGPAFMARRLRALSDQFVEDIQIFLTERGLNAPARALSALVLIAQKPGCGVTQLAEHLGSSHPLMINLLSQLETLGLVQFEADTTDRRRRLAFLTPEGEGEAKHIEAALPAIKAAYESLTNDIGANLWGTLNGLDQAMREKPYLERLRSCADDLMDTPKLKTGA